MSLDLLQQRAVRNDRVGLLGRAAFGMVGVIAAEGAIPVLIQP
jgi:hypothetical protein